MEGQYFTPDLQAKFDEIEQRLKALEEAVRTILKTEGISFALEQPSGVPPEVIEMARGGDRIGAIKRYRELTGASLEQARDVVGGL